MHLDEEQVQRVRHGELARGAEEPIRGHLADCGECRARVAEAGREEEEVYALLRQLDHRPPRIDANEVAARGRRNDFGRWRWAAGMLLVAGLAGAALAAPASPLREWVATVVQQIRAGTDRPEPPTAPVPRPEPALAGIAVAPGRELLILFRASQASGQARVSLTRDAEVMVRTLVGTATFTADASRLLIDNRESSASFEIQIPQNAPRVEIRVNGVRIFLKQGSRVTVERSSGNRNPYLIPLTP